MGNQNTETNKKKRKVDKDPNKPKRPPSAFLIYLNENRESIVETVGSKNPAEVGKLGSERWKELPPDERTKFTDQAERLKQEYHKSMTIYNTKLENDKKSEKVEAQNNKSEVKISKVRIPKSKPENENPKAMKKIVHKNENKSVTP